MNNFVKLAGMALMGALGLMPAQAATITQFGEFLQIVDFPPAGELDTVVSYANVAGNFGAAPGITVNPNNTDPNAVLTFAPNPALQFGGLTSGALGLASGSATANVSGNLATGATHISSTTAYINGVTQSNTSTSIGMIDGLTFLVAGGGSANVTMTFVLDGDVSTTNLPESSYSSEIQYFIGSADMVWTGQVAGVGTPAVGTGNTSGFNSFTYTNNTISGFQFQGTFTVTNGESLQLSFAQQMNCNNGEICDFSNTGQMGLILPTGTTFTSDSGVFLTQSDGSAAPEPGSLSLMGLGIVAMGWFGRRQLTRQA